jgi:hypothetical protein
MELGIQENDSHHADSVALSAHGANDKGNQEPNKTKWNPLTGSKSATCQLFTPRAPGFPSSHVGRRVTHVDFGAFSRILLWSQVQIYQIDVVSDGLRFDARARIYVGIGYA